MTERGWSRFIVCLLAMMCVCACMQVALVVVNGGRAVDHAVAFSWLLLAGMHVGRWHRERAASRRRQRARHYMGEP